MYFFLNALETSSICFFLVRPQCAYGKKIKWLNWLLILASDLSKMLDIIRSLWGQYKSRLSLNLIWHVVVWSIWKSLNYSIFSWKFVNMKNLFKQCIFSSWKLYHGRSSDIITSYMSRRQNISFGWAISSVRFGFMSRGGLMKVVWLSLLYGFLLNWFKTPLISKWWILECFFYVCVSG